MKIGNLIRLVTIFDKIRKEYLGTWKSAKTWKFLMGTFLFKIDNRNTKTRYEVCSKLRIKTPERRQWRQNLVYKSVQILQCISYISKCSKQIYNVESFGRYFSFCPRLIRRNHSCLISFRLQYLMGFKENLRMGYSQNHKHSLLQQSLA